MKKLLSVGVVVLVLSAGLLGGSRDVAQAANPLDQILATLTQLQTSVNNLQTQLNTLQSKLDLRGVTQNWDKKLSATDGGDPCNSSRFTCVLDGAGVRDNQ